jgi:hypothetical protein
MSIRKKNLIGYGLLAALAIATYLTSQALVNRASSAKAGRITARSSSLAVQQPATQEERRAPARKHYTSYRTIAGLVPSFDDGQIGLVVDVETWSGETHFPSIRAAERATRLRVLVYSPDDPGRQGEPIASWYSPAVEVQPGLYQERIAVSIPMQPNPKPYPVTAELISSSPVLTVQAEGDEASFAPRAFSGDSLLFQVR